MHLCRRYYSPTEIMLYGIARCRGCPRPRNYTTRSSPVTHVADLVAPAGAGNYTGPMKIDKISINKTAEQPEGVEIEIIQPENKLEEGVLGFLLAGLVRDLKRDGRIPYELPDRFRMEHRTGGTFIAFGGPGEGAYYEPPKPLGIFGIRHVNGRFDLIHAPAVAARPQGEAQPAAPATPAPEPNTAAEPRAEAAPEEPEK
jgi:hypothetical protein